MIYRSNLSVLKYRVHKIFTFRCQKLLRVPVQNISNNGSKWAVNEDVMWKIVWGKNFTCHQCFITRHIVSIYLKIRLKSINTPTFSLNIELITDISDILGLLNQWEVLPTRVKNSAVFL